METRDEKKPHDPDGLQMTQDRAITHIPARFIATAGGAGYSPIAPGTCGTAVAVPIVWALASLGPLWFCAITIVITAIGIWAATISDDFWGTHDSGRIVIDEVAGFFVTMAFVDRGSAAALGFGFILFRAFDIIKPPPVRWLDQNLPRGWGVVLDDIAAGIMGCAVMLFLDHYEVLSSFDAWFGT
jgi:phosphatidylglycerophosphatase A